MTAFYVTHEVDGDECVMFHRDSFQEAERALRAEAEHNRDAVLCIYGTGPAYPSGVALLAMWNGRGQRLTLTRAGTAAIQRQEPIGT